MRSFSKLCGVCVILAMVTNIGCFVTTNDPQPDPVVVTEPTQPPAPTTSSGTVRVEWTIDGRADPEKCIKSIVSNIQVTIYDAARIEVGMWQQNCEKFALGIPLNAGGYSASAVLIDGAGQPRTITIDIVPFAIRGNDTLEIPIDFPARSFL